MVINEMSKLNNSMPWLVPLVLSLITFSAYTYVSMVKVEYLEVRITKQQEQIQQLHDDVLELKLDSNKFDKLCCSEIKGIEK